MMQRTFSVPMTKPEGALREVVFPQLARMGEWTGDLRMLEAAGGGVRALPRTIYAQHVNDFGHSGAVVVGTLCEATFHDDGNVSGRGWLLNDENGRRQAFYLQTGALRHNSVDLADVEVELEIIDDDPDSLFWEIGVRFTKWNIGATTFVGVPAFPDAHGELTDEEITAALVDLDEPLVVEFASTSYRVVEGELTASCAPLPAYEDFFRPEPSSPQAIWVDESGVVTGHLALWDTYHDAVTGRPIKPPVPGDNYASFNKPGVLTDKGPVETGPIFLLGGHKRGEDLHAAYGGIENAWADVHIVAGKLGPWMSGRVRPGVDEDKIYAARASRVSGHWIGGRLKAIVSVNAEGFDVPGSGFSRTGAVARFSAVGEMLELVASLPLPMLDNLAPEGVGNYRPSLVLNGLPNSGTVNVSWSGGCTTVALDEGADVTEAPPDTADDPSLLAAEIELDEFDDA